MRAGKHIFPKNGSKIFLRLGLDIASDNTKLICPTGTGSAPSLPAFSNRVAGTYALSILQS
jgi:hypothetical protein